METGLPSAGNTRTLRAMDAIKQKLPDDSPRTSLADGSSPHSTALPQTVAARAAEALAVIASLDLSMVRKKVVALEGWDERIADYSELRYRRFLSMHLMDCTLPLVPPHDIDAWWHQHILFTREYARDCLRLFGGFLHHSPASGADEEAELLRQEYLKVASFYYEAFGEDYSATDPEGTAANWLEFFV